MMHFGIREKVAVLVVIATAASAMLVANILSDAGAAAVREHELVDLGDEALVRGWTLADQIAGLEDDIQKLSHNQDFINIVFSENPNVEQLREMAQDLCRRYWKRHLRIDICESKDKSLFVLREKAQIPADKLWFPAGGAARKARLDFSPIQPITVKYADYYGVGEISRREPIVTAVEPIGLNRPGANGEVPSKRLFLRISMSLENNKSPRHLFYLEDKDFNPLVNHDDNETIDLKNREVFKSFHDKNDPNGKKILEALAEELEKKNSIVPGHSDITENPKVVRIAKTEGVELKQNYYFLEGIPGDRLRKALETKEGEDGSKPFETVEEFDRFLAFMMATCEKAGYGRAGGLKGGVKELRLLAQSPEQLKDLKKEVEKLLAAHYGDEFDKIDWRDVVPCTKIHAWAVVLTVEQQEGEDQHYVLHYCVMDEELASAISNEMEGLRYVSVGIAGGFGVLGFLIVMFFINPLKRMTRTAQQITESPSDQLIGKLSELTRDLDIRRRDEVGDIARSSKRLFEEIITFHGQLDQRVKDRTRELRRSNIDLEEAYKQLMSLSHEKDAFVAKVSHDLRQPLNAIFLQVEALKLSELDDVQKDDVQRIHDHARRELNLVNDILEYQKIIMGAETLNKDEIDVATLVEDVEDVHGKTAQAKGLTFDAQFDDEIGSLVADDRRLHQILGNLVGNSVKFTKEGSVSINAHARDISGEPWIEFTVTDTGRGMSPAEQAKVFVPFVSNKKDNAGGSGLGLSICKELAGQMGGKIGFVSELDKGTHFSVFLPRVPTSEHYDEKKQDDLVNPLNKIVTGEPPSSDDEQAEERISIRKGTKILVVDDDENVRELLKRLLEGDGYTVLTAEDGNVGLKMAQEYLPDAITLDVVMPGGKDGWEVLKHLKNNPETEPIPVIMVSVMAGEENGAVLDVEDYLVKPIDVNRLKRVVGRVTEEASQRNLLLVDDDVDSLETLSRLLVESGWQTTLATNGKEALAVLEKTLPAAIVLDLMMPEMDGFEFLQRIRAEKTLRNIPVVIMTGKIPSDDEKAFLRSHVTTILTKGEASGADLLESINERIKASR